MSLCRYLMGPDLCIIGKRIALEYVNAKKMLRKRAFFSISAVGRGRLCNAGQTDVCLPGADDWQNLFRPSRFAPV